MRKRIRLSVVLSATPAEVYNAWMSSQGHSVMTGSTAHIAPRPGGDFDAWDGYITGRTLELTPNTRIVQAWRTADFAQSDPDSRIEVTLHATRGGTRLTLVHSEIPEGQADDYQAGWEEWYFLPMRDCFTKRSTGS